LTRADVVGIIDEALRIIDASDEEIEDLFSS
jgi:hypothetical protein